MACACSVDGQSDPGLPAKSLVALGSPDSRGERRPRRLRVHPRVEVGERVFTEGLVEGELARNTRANESLNVMKARLLQDLT
jgi:hypothetical protein